MPSHLHQEDIAAIWQVQRTRLPLLRRLCPDCTTDVSAATGKFRVNASGKLLDVWLLIRCVHCGHTAKVTVHDRTNVRSLDPLKLRGYNDNNLDLVTEVLLDPLIGRRNHYSLDWTDAWELAILEVQPPGDQRIDVRVEFADHVPVRPVRLIAQGLGLSRGEVERLITDKRIDSNIKLNRKTSSSFEFAVLPGSF
ncbi:MAG: DUF1062 domain-containing protein [Actinomycetota bacterium]